MYPINNNEILEVSIKGRLNAQVILSILHYRYEGPAQADGLAFINLFNPLFNSTLTTSVVGAYRAVVNTDFQFEEIVYQWIYPTRRARAVKTPLVAVGTREGTPAPQVLAIALTKGSDTPGRHGHGTLHLAGVCNEDMAAGQFTNVARDTYGTLQTRLAEAVVVATGQIMQPVIYNRVAPSTSVDITGVTNNATVRTMHRRTVGVGE